MRAIIGYTSIDLLDALCDLCSEVTKHLVLPVKPERPGGEAYERRPKVYKMDLPKKEDDTKQIPYIIVQVLSGTDVQKEGVPPDSSCGVRIVFGVYSEDMGEGRLNVLNLIDRVRAELLRRRVIGGNFLLSNQIDWAIDPANTSSYYFGEMIMSFEMPPIMPDIPDFIIGAYGDKNYFNREEELDCLKAEISK